MAGLKISQLTKLEQMTGTEAIPVEKGGENYSMTPDVLLKDVKGGMAGLVTRLNDYAYDVSLLMGKMAVRGTRVKARHDVSGQGVGAWKINGEIGSSNYARDRYFVKPNHVYHINIAYPANFTPSENIALLLLYDKDGNILKAIPATEAPFDKYLCFTSEVYKYGVSYTTYPGAVYDYVGEYEIEDVNDVLSDLSEKDSSMRDDFNNYISDVTNLFGKMVYRDGVGTNDKNVSQEDGYYDTRGKLKIQTAGFVYQKLQVYPSKIYRIRQMVGSYSAVSALVLFDEHDEIISTVPYNYSSVSSDKYFVFAGVHSVGISFVKSDNNSRLESFDIQDLTTVLNTQQGNRALYVAAGAVYNKQTGFYELNGLTDITEEQMKDIYNYTYHLEWRTEYQGGLNNVNFRTNLGFQNNNIYNYQGRTFDLNNGFRGNKTLEILNFGKETDELKRWPYQIVNLGDCFYQTPMLRVIRGYITYNSAVKLINFSRLTRIEHIRFVKLITNMNISGSPYLSLDSLQFLIQEATNTSPITITVHADVYAKIQDETQTEWHALIASAQEKQITFATV